MQLDCGKPRKGKARPVGAGTGFCVTEVILLGMTAKIKSRVKVKTPPITRTELNRILGLWPDVMRTATDEWTKEFAFSIWNQSGDTNWRPTFKQTKVMRTLARETKPRVH